MAAAHLLFHPFPSVQLTENPALQEGRFAALQAAHSCCSARLGSILPALPAATGICWRSRDAETDSQPCHGACGLEGWQQEPRPCSQRAVPGVWAARPPFPWFRCPCSRDCASPVQLPRRVKMFHLRQTLVSLSARAGSALSARCLAWRHLFCVQAFERKNSPKLSTDMKRLPVSMGTCSAEPRG